VKLLTVLWRLSIKLFKSLGIVEVITGRNSITEKNTKNKFNAAIKDRETFLNFYIKEFGIRMIISSPVVKFS
jgi:hypothetical protein